MILRRALLSGIAIGCAIGLSGCSSLSSGQQDETLTFTSLPSKASIRIVNVTGLNGYVDIQHRGETIFSGQTPVTLDLDGTSEDGKTLRSYVVAIDKPGYERYETRLEAVGNEARLRSQDVAQSDQATFLGWRLEDPKSHNLTQLPYNHVDVTLENLND